MGKWWRRFIDFLADYNEEESWHQKDSDIDKSQIDTFVRNLEQHNKLVNECRNQYVSYIIRVIKRHYKTLETKYEQLVYTDDYGCVKTEDFLSEFNYFFANVLCSKDSTIYPEMYICEEPELWDSYKKLTVEYWGDSVYSRGMESVKPTYDWHYATFFCFSVDLKDAEKVTDKGQPDITFTIVEDSFKEKERVSSLEGDELMTQIRSKIMSIALAAFDYIRITQNILDYTAGVKKKRTAPNDPLEYEKYVSGCLKDLGFKARPTKASGDQGADVLAEKNGVSFAIQCKKYSGTVGNKAVQEANAGRDFYKCDYGVVVSNASFTKSARQAANACKIILLNDRQLEKLLKYVPDGDANK